MTNELKTPDGQLWTPQYMIVMTVVASTCLCLVVLVLGTVLGVLTGRISASEVGELKGACIASGLLGFGLLLYMILRLALNRRE